ncbi:hemolysin family protein [Pseudazoarcus pumilus]|uniref:hemolysin family protein n=1 Tax=Pseudazoarcus pumilus TaxID=2067960 RepID=UPI001D1716D3|nr:hemolysin family protein [Pseudazoarcus pumilus]
MESRRVEIASQLLLIGLLIVVSAWLSISEIALAASRKIRLRMLAQQGSTAAEDVLRLQENPGHFFTVVQIGLNAVAILGGILGESVLAPAFAELIGVVYAGQYLAAASSVLAFVLVTSAFVLLADLIPKRLAMNAPERVAVIVVGPMRTMVKVFMPAVWLFDGFANWIFRVLGLPSVRPEDITSEEIVAMADAGAQAGALLRQEHQLIANVFELDERTVTSAMTARDSVVFFTLDESEEHIREKLVQSPHGKFPVCEGGIDTVVGYVESKELFARVLAGKKLSLIADPQMHEALVLPDTLTLFEALERFRAAREDFALIVNEYALIVGLLTLQDVMNTVMGELGSNVVEELIVRRDDASWLIDGVTPVEDVMAALGIDTFEDAENYETIAGFMMYRLRKVPKRTDKVEFAGFRFEVVDIDNYRIDQLLVTRIADATVTQWN